MFEEQYSGKKGGTQGAVTVITFYRFFPFTDFTEWRGKLLSGMLQRNIKGSILIAPEGINATISGEANALDALMAEIKSIPALRDLTVKKSACAEHPFGRAKVRLKKELIPMGVTASPERLTGIHANAQEWNALLADPGTYLLDARNDYEVHVGTFRGAVNPKTKSFRELPAFIESTLDPAKHTRIATYCTGGIRCEKLTSWLLEKGFSEVYQLGGGILQYLEDVKLEESLWEGECFVFDERVAVDHGLAASDDASMCSACGHPLLPQDRASALYIKDEACPYCA